MLISKKFNQFSATYRIVSLVLVFSVVLPANGHPPLHHLRLVHLLCPKLDTKQVQVYNIERMTMQRLTRWPGGGTSL